MAVAVVWAPASGVAQQAGVCDQAIAEAGTGQGTYGRYALVQAPAAGRSGSQVVVGTAGPDRLMGGSGNDVLCGLDGDDVLLGDSGNDVLEGGDGSDELQGGSGHDVLDGGSGFDRHFGGSGNDTLRNGEVNDGGSGRDEVAPPPPPVDISSTMPQAQRDEVTGDLLGRGYDQRMHVLSLNSDGSQGPPLSNSDPSYQRIYYREELSQALITNLFGADIDNFIGVSPYAGAYPNNGSADSGPVGVFNGFHYVATTSTIDQHIVGYVALGAVAPGASVPIEVHGSGIDPQNSTTSAADGVSLEGCQDFIGVSTCQLAQVDIDSTTGAGTPAMYLDTTSGVEIGVLTAAQVTTAVASLPLQHPSGTPVHSLATAQLTMSDGAATLTDTSAFQSGDTVDTSLVTHGILVAPILNIPVS